MPWRERISSRRNCGSCLCALLASLCCCAVVTHARLSMAQCGAPESSCRRCHDADVRIKPSAEEPWHRDHVFGDFCADCHGGNREASDARAAHLGLASPLDNEAARCVVCHQNASSLAGAYREWKSGQAPAPPRTGNGPPKDERPTNRGTSPARNAAALATLVLLAVMGGAYIARNERRRRGEAGRWSLPNARSVEWSPYLAGALLGVVAAVSMYFFGHRLSGGGAYPVIAAPLGKLVSPASVYWNRIAAASSRWDLTAVTGAVIGAFAAARASRTFRVRSMPDSQWSDVFGDGVVKRWIVGFAGAALTEFAAGIAGGCTASLAVSGGAALAPGAFAFMMGMFVGGIPTAWLVYRRAAG